MTRRSETVWIVTSIQPDHFMRHYVYASVETAKRDYEPPPGETWRFDRDLSRWSWTGDAPRVWIELHAVIR